MPSPNLFLNHDDCGDIIIPIGNIQVQVINTVTNIFFVIAALMQLHKAKASASRQNSTLLLAVALFSSFYHATSLWGGFLLDITSMAIWCVHIGMAAEAYREALHLPTLLTPTSRLFVASVAAGAAVGGPVLAYEAFGASPTQTWDVWANSFAVLVALGVLFFLYTALEIGTLGKYVNSVLAGVAFIGAGVIFTQLIHVLCVPGTFTSFPLHSLWHLCAASSAYIVTDVCEQAFAAAARDGGEKGKR